MPRDPSKSSARGSVKISSSKSSARGSVKISSSKSSARGSARGSAQSSSQSSARSSGPKFSIETPPSYADTEKAQQAVYATPFPTGPPSTYNERNEAYKKEQRKRQSHATRLYKLWASSSSRRQSIVRNRAMQAIEEEKPRTKCNVLRDRVKFFQQIYDRNKTDSNKVKLETEEKKLAECKEDDQEEEDDEVFHNRVEQQMETQQGLNIKMESAPFLRGVKIPKLDDSDRPSQDEIDRFDDKDLVNGEKLKPESSMKLSDGHCYSDDDLINLYDVAFDNMVSKEAKQMVNVKTFIRKEKGYFKSRFGVPFTIKDVQIALWLKNLKKDKNSANSATKKRKTSANSATKKSKRSARR